MIPEDEWEPIAIYSSYLAVNKRHYTYLNVHECTCTTHRDDLAAQIAAEGDMTTRVTHFIYDADSFKLLAEDPEIWDVDSDSIEEAENFWIATSAETGERETAVHFDQKVNVRLATRRTWARLFGNKGVRMPAPLAEMEDDEAPGPNRALQLRPVASTGDVPAPWRKPNEGVAGGEENRPPGAAGEGRSAVDSEIDAWTRANLTAKELVGLARGRPPTYEKWAHRVHEHPLLRKKYGLKPGEKMTLKDWYVRLARPSLATRLEDRCTDFSLSIGTPCRPRAFAGTPSARRASSRRWSCAPRPPHRIARRRCAPRLSRAAAGSPAAGQRR